MMIVAIFIILLIVLIFKLSYTKSRQKYPPYPSNGVPFFGHLFQLGERPHLKLAEWGKTCGSIFTVNLGMQK
jgi:hypothetical protein